MSSPKYVESKQKPMGGQSSPVKYAIGGGSRPNGSTKIVTKSSAPMNAQKIRG